MSETETCPRCGTALPANAPGGICPKCLLEAGMQSESQADPPPSNPEAPTAASPAPSFAPPEVSALADQFPQLEILELLGHGGMGAVYKARQINLDRLVALKIIRPEATHDPTFAERFNREAKTLARLNHQHIVAVYDFGEVEYSASDNQGRQPLYFFLMEYVDGANLRQLMRAGHLEPEQALAIVPQICDALQYAHDEGVVHRDIKPENILLDTRGRVKIADFGLAKLATHSPEEYTLTALHQVMGTPRYMAPEQMEGSHSVDHRADIYSLGVVFYEMLTGEAPMGHFDPPSKKVEVDVRLDEVVLRSLAREPERRYQHASEVKTDVESIHLAAATNPSRSQFASPAADDPRLEASDLSVNLAQDNDLQREQELAEIAPDWLCYLFIGLFGAGWIVVGLLWNFRWPGLAVAIAVMAGITYYVVQWKLAYLPKLRQELERIPPWSRYAALASALVTFVIGMLAVVAFQANVGDSLSNMQMLGVPQGLGLSATMSEQARKSALSAAKLEGLEDVAIVSGGGFRFTPRWVLLFSTGAWAVLFLPTAVATLIHTRRYRYSWKHWWAPSFSVVWWCLMMLIAVHGLHLAIVGYAETSAGPREMRCEASWEDVEAALRNWSSRNGYFESGYANWKLLKDETEVGGLRGRHFMPRSRFDGYQASWDYMVLRPHPPLYMTVVTRQEPPETYLQVDFPHPIKGSPEKTMWMALVDDLEAELNALPKREETDGK